MTGRMLRSAYADPSKVGPEDVDQYCARWRSPLSAVPCTGCCTSFASTRWLDAWRCPDPYTQCRGGNETSGYRLGLGRALASELPRVAYLSVANAGHALPEEAPAEVSRLVIAFLKDGIPGPPLNLATRAATTGR
jgi:pimeloyl-ACP methyl ester carboxylesterase